MFLCGECIKNYFILVGERWTKGGERDWISTSYGPCEECGKTASCIDVPHNHYAHKDSIYAKEQGLR